MDPVNPLRGDALICDVAVRPVAVMLFGLADKEKSTKWKAIWVELQIVPLQAVTVTISDSALSELQDRVVLAFVTKVTETGLSMQVPFGGKSVVRVTIPVKPCRLVRFIVDLPSALTFTVTLVGLAVIVKPGLVTVYVTNAKCSSVPLVPATPTMKLPVADAVHESVDVPALLVMVVDDRLHVRLAGIATVSETAPRNPLIGLTVIVDVPAAPSAALTLVGLAVTVKSWVKNMPVTL